ncbi:hypothetical protein V8B55DRAFT_1549993 [Mucor lusitanicus]|uniref:Uncharacterized protein n=2 Tax=Mucor circinelloides f. lusitanicus TaxID=29924 RepID=A0A162RKT6_MUCCL|nr:hypothetical protein FB192DRAFT_1396847 [Mucor lusitanicus]OAD06879.1 hypothetical protein MUCCIDRAFT_155424 [Mucor lusitanicus CBS 277.49]
MSSNEYYQRIGNVAYNRFAQHHREQNAADDNIISTLPTLKTSNFTELKQAVDMRIRHYNMTKRFYGYINTWSLELYKRKQRCLQEMMKQLVGGSKKYSVNTKSFNAKTKQPGVQFMPNKNSGEKEERNRRRNSCSIAVHSLPFNHQQR